VKILKEKDQKEEKELEVALKLIEQTLATTKLRAERAEAENQKLLNEINLLKEQLRQAQQSTPRTEVSIPTVSRISFIGV
jgi:chromosome segregation ATPase